MLETESILQAGRIQFCKMLYLEYVLYSYERWIIIKEEEGYLDSFEMNG